ncbi:MAG: RusA family crossover junction endodeoxyribonuclease [Kiritimatiellae bacterium]|nr:RusA family crossover junction endodeoxyribonuclease [Kiritimatiellia bacterium]
MGEVSFELPWPPSVNRYYRHVGPRVLISREGRRFRLMAVSRLAGRFPKLTGRVELSGDFYPPDGRRRDLDNVLKCTLDSLVHAGLIGDDAQIKRIDIRMLEPMPPDGLVHLELKEKGKHGTERLPEGIRR